MVNTTQFVFSFALLLSFPLLFFLIPCFLSPKHLQISLPDELDDLALFRRATLASLNTPPAVSRLSSNPKIAFLFLTNTDLHFAPLWELFFRDNENLYNIYVHADPSSAVGPGAGGVFDGRFIAAKKTQRASPTLISAARRLLATALLDDPSNSYFTLVSQHCVPLRSFRYMYDFLFHRPVSGPRSRVPLYRSFIEISSQKPQLRERYVARGKNVMLPEVPFDRFRAGSQFFTLTRQHAQLVVRDRRLWRKFKLPCYKYNCYPEEHYFPTLLSMEDPDGCTGYTLTRVNWTGSVAGHPHTYRPPEVSPELIDELRLSNSSTYSFIFARKFSPDCLQPLIQLAELLFQD